MIRVGIAIPEAYAPRAEYVFRLFSEHWGIPATIVRGSECGQVDIRYSTAPDPGCRTTLHIGFDERLYDASRQCACSTRDGFRLWMGHDAANASFDPVAGSYRLLTYADEQQVPREARDRRGIFRSPALPPGRRQSAQIPMVDEHAAYVLQQLGRVRPELTQRIKPKWPNGKGYAVIVTHDTDAVTVGAASELATNLLKLVARRDRVYAEMFAKGLQCFRRPMMNPLFGFPLWCDFEAARHLRSCFYLFARLVPLKRDVNDCKSSVVEQRIDWRLLRQMADSGWEFGFHAPIKAKTDIDTFVRGKEWIEEKLGTALYGLRHHYWALDWLKPHLTFRKHVNCGFRYDSSIAWRDICGFRAGTSHPFRPFDPDRNKALDLYEIPTCVMDSHVIGRDGDIGTAVEECLRTVDHVKARGGVAVLNWHTESACNAYVYRHYRTVLEKLLAVLLRDDRAWFTTPWEIVQHWHRRCKELEVPRS